MSQAGDPEWFDPAELLAAVGLGTFWAVTVAGQDLAKEMLVRTGAPAASVMKRAQFAYGFVETLGGGLGLLAFGPLCVRLGRKRAFTWMIDRKAGVAHAKMNNGKGEVILEKVKGDDPNHEVVIHNLKYWQAQTNDGFRMWKSKHEAFDGKGHNFSYDGTNGFLITIHFSGQAKAPAAD